MVLEILKWIDDCPNDLFSALTFQGAKAWRNTLQDDFKNNNDVLKIINSKDDNELHELMTNLAGHDIEELSEVFLKNKKNKKPACFLCYTVKGFGLPLAGHKDNHSGIMNIEQFKVYQDSMNVKVGKEWNKIEGVKVEEKIFKEYLSNNIFYNTKTNRVFSDQNIKFIEKKLSFKNYTSTQDAFGIILNEIGKEKAILLKEL